METLGATLAGAAVALWLLGGAVIVSRHFERRGLPWHSAFTLIPSYLFHFNRREWLTLAGLFAAVCALAILGAILIVEGSRAI